MLDSAPHTVVDPGEGGVPRVERVGVAVVVEVEDHAVAEGGAGVRVPVAEKKYSTYYVLCRYSNNAHLSFPHFTCGEAGRS